MKTKLLALVLACGMLLSLLSGCGNDTTASSTVSDSQSSAAASVPPSAPAESTDTVTTPADSAVEPDTVSTAAWPENPLGPAENLPLTEDPVTLTMWMAINPNVLKIIDDPNTDCALWSELAQRTGVNLDFITLSPDTQTEKFNLMVSSDDLTDIISAATDIYTGGGDAAIAEDVLIDVKPYLTEELAPQICKLLENPDITDALLSDEGHIAGLPCIAQEAEMATTMGPIIRQDWLDDLGLEVPETYDELHDVLTAFKDEKGATDALLINNCGGGIDNGLINGYGVLGIIGDSVGIPDPFYQIDGKVCFGPTSEGYKEYLKMISQWYSEGLVYQDFMSYSDYQNPNTDLILSNKAGMFFGEVTYIASLEETSTDDNFTLSAIANPVQKSGDTIPFKQASNYNASTPWSISTACDEVELAVQWCNYMYTDEGAVLCNYGIEGESFEFDENGTPVFTDLVMNNPDMSTTVALFMYCMDRGPFYRDDRREQSNYTEAQKAASDIWKSNMVEGRDMGRYALTSAETEEAGTWYSDIKTYATEKILQFIIGAEDVEKGWDEYVSTIEGMGIDNVIEIYQTAYDRYMAGDQVEEAPPEPPAGAPAP